MKGRTPEAKLIAKRPEPAASLTLKFGNSIAALDPVRPASNGADRRSAFNHHLYLSFPDNFNRFIPEAISDGALPGMNAIAAIVALAAALASTAGFAVGRLRRGTNARPTVYKVARQFPAGGMLMPGNSNFGHNVSGALPRDSHTRPINRPTQSPKPPRLLLAGPALNTNNEHSN